MSLLLEVGVYAAITVANTPWTAHQPYQVPYLTLLKSVCDTNFSVQFHNESRTYMRALNQLNPSTALWSAEVNYRYDNLLVGLGHTSEHEVDNKDKLTESFDYVRASYQIKY